MICMKLFTKFVKCILGKGFRHQDRVNLTTQGKQIQENLLSQFPQRDINRTHADDFHKDLYILYESHSPKERDSGLRVDQLCLIFENVLNLKNYSFFPRKLDINRMHVYQTVKLQVPDPEVQALEFARYGHVLNMDQILNYSRFFSQNRKISLNA